MELCDLPAYKIARLVRSKEASALEVVDSFISRVKQLDGVPLYKNSIIQEAKTDINSNEKIHAFISLTEENARTDAKRIDEQISKGEDPGPLTGVPYAVNDNFCTESAVTTAGSRALINYIPPYTATVITHLNKSGAVMLGKTNIDEFGIGLSTESSAFYPTRNPWKNKRTPGGSSGGSAAAVAARECAFSLGSDSDGSIRQPASFCGVVGLRPTYGRVSRYGLISANSSIECPGPLARNITDLALALGAIAGPDSKDLTTANAPVPDYLKFLGRGCANLKIGISEDYLKVRYLESSYQKYREEPVNRDVRTRFDEAVKVLEDSGAKIIRGINLPHSVYGIPIHLLKSAIEGGSNLQRYDGVKFGKSFSTNLSNLDDIYHQNRGEGFGLYAKLKTLLGAYLSLEPNKEKYFIRAKTLQALIREDFERAFERIDLILTPTTPSLPFKLIEFEGDLLLLQKSSYFTIAPSLAGLPAISFPAGFSEEGMPIGLQLIGRKFQEELMLQAVCRYEIATENESWRRIAPSLLG